MSSALKYIYRSNNLHVSPSRFKGFAKVHTVLRGLLKVILGNVENYKLEAKDEMMGHSKAKWIQQQVYFLTLEKNKPTEQQLIFKYS